MTFSIFTELFHSRVTSNLNSVYYIFVDLSFRISNNRKEKDKKDRKLKEWKYYIFLSFHYQFFLSTFKFSSLLQNSKCGGEENCQRITDFVFLLISFFFFSPSFSRVTPYFLSGRWNLTNFETVEREMVRIKPLISV